MLYDNGGVGGQRPMPKPLAPTALAGAPDYRNQAMFNLGLLNKRLPAYRQLLQAQGPNSQIPMEQAGPNRQTAVGQPQMAMYPQPPRPQFQFGGAGGAAGGSLMGYRTPQQLYQRDINGRPPGSWGYQPPQYGNPFLPMVAK